MSGKNESTSPRLKTEQNITNQDASVAVAANVTVGNTPASGVVNRSRDAPVVIAPIAEVSMADQGQSNTAVSSALQAITALLQGGSQPLNVSDYIGALVAQATAQESKAPGPMAGLTLGSLPLGLPIGQSTPSLANAVEGLFSLAPAVIQPQVINQVPGPIKVETTNPERGSNIIVTSTVPSASASADAQMDDQPGSPQSLVGSDDYGSAIKKRRAQLSRTRDEKLVCLVCGDKALGCNFDAVSCESCKAFFRRNALKDKKGKCLFEGSCKIDVNTRRFCPHCRLEKCFTVGMKKEFILSEEAKRKRSQKKDRLSKDDYKDDMNPLSPPATPSTPAPPPATPSPLPIVPSPQSVINHTLQTTLSSQNQPTAQPINDEAATNMQAVTITSLTQPTTYTLPTAAAPTQITLEIPAGSTESVNLLSLSRFVKTTENFNVPMDSYLVRRLTVEESQMLQELMQIYDLSFTVDLEPLVHIKQVDPSLNQLVNQSSITVLRIIKFAKRLEEFVRLPQECQIGILKGCWIHMLLLRSVSAYDNERDLWVTPRGEIPTGILKNATGFDRLHDDHVKYCKSIRSIIKDDLTIVVLLIVTALFAPEGPHVITRELVSNIQDKYLVLLKHYLESKYMYGRAAEMFPQLMSKMKELKELAEDHGKYLLDVNPNEIEPIMLEILDLK